MDEDGQLISNCSTSQSINETFNNVDTWNARSNETIEKPINIKSNQSATAKKPAQEATQKDISQLENKVNSLFAAKNAGLGTEETDALLSKLQKQLDEQKKLLKSKNQSDKRNFAMLNE